MFKFKICLSVLLFVTCFRSNLALAENDWSRKIVLGYNKSNGNTNNSELDISGEAKLSMTDAEFLSRFSLYYSSTDDKMDSQKWQGLARYSKDFGKNKIWFNSYQLKVDHDKFAKIDYRITPSTGIGYWFSKEEEWKLMTEGSLGYESTTYKDNTSDTDEAIVIGRLFCEKKVFDNAKLTEDISVIPSLTDDGIRITSETEFINPVSENIDLSIKYALEHDTDPASDAKKTDTRIMTSLVYSF